MQRIYSFITAWITGLVLMVLNWLNVRIELLGEIMAQLDPEHWEAWAGFFMNMCGAASFIVGIYIALRYGKSIKK